MSMTIDFWQRVYLQAMEAGDTSGECATKADGAARSLISYLATQPSRLPIHIQGRNTIQAGEAADLFHTFQFPFSLRTVESGSSLRMERLELGGRTLWERHKGMDGYPIFPKHFCAPGTTLLVRILNTSNEPLVPWLVADGETPGIDNPPHP